MSEELLLEKSSSIEPLIHENNKPHTKISKLPLILAAISLFGVVGLIALLITINNNNIKENQQLKSQLEATQKQIKDQEPKFAKIDAVEASTKQLRSLAMMSFLIHEIEGGVVTDDFVIAKVSFYEFDKNLKLTIDTDTQPDLRLKYKGKGTFDLSDRELRTKSTNIITQVKDYYNKHKDLSMVTWDDKAEVFLTIKNYDIGKMSGAQFILTGEK